MPAILNLETNIRIRTAETSIGKPVKVLCVDDLPANLLALEATLSDLGLEIVMASSGPDALRCLLKEDFAVILLDVKMPGMDGLETAEFIRQRKRCQHTPIIFLTAWEADDQQMFKGYSLGAVDYLCKPIVPRILRSKVAVFVDIHRQAAQIREQATQLLRLEQQAHERRLTEATERFEREKLCEEIRLARQIQQKLFPKDPLLLAGFDISGGSYPAEATGGDYFDYLPMLDGSFGVVIGDVSGHGLGPAMMMTQLRAYLRAFLLTRTDVGDVVSLLNNTLAMDGPECHFATLFLARLDPISRSLVYSSAGHLPGYILDPSGEVKAVLNSTGMPLGVLPDGDFAAASAPPLEPGEVLLLLTDGIMEAHGTDVNLFGINRILELVRANRSRTAREIVDSLYSAVRAFCGTQTQHDDMTTIVIKATSPSAPA